MRSKRRSPLSESKSSNANYRVIDSLEKQNVDEYNSGLSFCYDCIKWGGREPPKTTPDAAPFRDGKS
ncbi:hypothetical protein WN944_026729 [Citrus x changshan-huyou]|uniref:Uncharacterized protein n=1 Tax=Citrus x changshan-huyou TaxID=2935761 RepID=A0AAP0QDJ0_9ROSI